MSDEHGGDGDVLPLGELLDAEAELSIFRPPWPFLSELIETCDEWSEEETLPTMTVVSDHGPLSLLRREFMLAGRAANLIDADTLTLRERGDGDSEDNEDTPWIVGESLYVPVVIDGEVYVERVADESLRADAGAAFERSLADAELFPLRTPPLKRVVTTVEDRFGPKMHEDMAETLRVADGLRDATEFDAVTATLIVAAHNNLLHYEVGKWIEDVGIASRATVSRRKNALEESEVIDTEAVQEGFGRPRQRLVLQDAYADAAARRGIGEVVTHVVA
jgi:hypothetical protein